MKNNLLCRNCESPVIKDTSDSQWDYPYECIKCDESFFEFELIKRKK
tara:strand:+ start:993 stop:1133 length:141 start_codon:yes stop_codon:yes gene_type:complete